jgi:hypothetical protein
MGLLDLKTDLKSLKYGNDQRGGGSSNQPYVVTPIPDGFADTSPDFLLRNGYLNPLSSIQDVSRLTKMFLDTKSPNGLLFITKQELLERQNPIQTNTDRVYSPLNTLAQAGVVSLGGHLNKQGLNPFTPGYYNGGRSGYFFSTLAENDVNDGINGGENRLALLYTSKVANQPLETLSLNPFGVTDFNDSVNLLSYSGGPNSVLGFGKTNIRIQNPTRTVVPKERATVAFGSSQVDNVNYLTPLYSPTINWNYNPNFFQRPELPNGAIEQYRVRISGTGGIINESELFNNNILNRDTSTVIPIGKPANNFAKSQSTLKSEPGYLVPSNVIGGNIVYQTSLTGSSNIFKDKIDETISGYVNQAKKVLPTGSLYSSSSIDKETYSEVRVWSNVLDEQNILSLTAVSREYSDRGVTNINNEILNNFEEEKNIPDIYEVPNDIVQGLEENRTTTLSSLNPRYFKLNSITKEIASVSAFDNTLKDFNREKTYKTLTTSYSASRGNTNSSISSDEVNLSRILLEGNNTKDIEDLKQSDLIKFFFEINNNNGDTNTQNWFLFFRAYLNDLGDNFKADWQSYKYVGRAENFYKYSGFSRDISLSFTIYAHSRAEMASIYEKLNYLVGTTAPDYSNAGYMRGNFINMTVGDYLDNVPGIIQGINLKPSFDAGWDIDRDVLDGNPLQQSYLQLPRMIEVDLQFTPIHTFTPQFGEAFIRNAIQPPKPTISIQQPTQDGVA